MHFGAKKSNIAISYSIINIDGESGGIPIYRMFWMKCFESWHYMLPYFSFGFLSPSLFCFTLLFAGGGGKTRIPVPLATPLLSCDISKRG